MSWNNNAQGSWKSRTHCNVRHEVPKGEHPFNVCLCQVLSVDLPVHDVYRQGSQNTQIFEFRYDKPMCSHSAPPLIMRLHSAVS